MADIRMDKDTLVRPAVAVLAYESIIRGQRRTYANDASFANRDPFDWDATIVDGSPDQIAARVREALNGITALYEDGSYIPDSCSHMHRSTATARVLAALGITTEARDAE